MADCIVSMIAEFIIVEPGASRTQILEWRGFATLK